MADHEQITSCLQVLSLTEYDLLITKLCHIDYGAHHLVTATLEQAAKSARGGNFFGKGAISDRDVGNDWKNS